MSTSNKSGGCKECNPCNKCGSGSKSTRSSGGCGGGSGTGNGSGTATCPGGNGGSGGPGASIAKDANCKMDSACQKDLARQIDEKICNAKGNPGPGQTERCYDCSNVKANINGKCKCGKWKGTIQMSPGDVAQGCQEVQCGAVPCGGPGQPPC